MASKSQDGVTVKLSADEALVLFEWLWRWQETGTLEIRDPAEQAPLWSIGRVLDKTLVEPFMPDYQQRLKAACDRLRRKVGGSDDAE